MAADFIGSNVLVTLKSPPKFQIRGVVENIEDQVLFLKDGRFLLVYIVAVELKFLSSVD